MIDYGSFVEKLDFTFGRVHIYVDVGRRNLELEVDKRMLCITAESSQQQHSNQWYTLNKGSTKPVVTQLQLKMDASQIK